MDSSLRLYCFNPAITLGVFLLLGSGLSGSCNHLKNCDSIMYFKLYVPIHLCNGSYFSSFLQRSRNICTSSFVMSLDSLLRTLLVPINSEKLTSVCIFSFTL